MSWTYLHDAAYQYAQDVGLQQRSPQTHATSALLLSMLLHFSGPFLVFSAVVSSSSSWVLLPTSPLPTFLLPAPPLLLPANPVHGVAHVDQAGRGHKHNLQHLRKTTRGKVQLKVVKLDKRRREMLRSCCVVRRIVSSVPSIVCVLWGRLGRSKRSRSLAVPCRS